MKRFNSRGQGMTEYILIVALIAVAVIGAVKYFGHSTKDSFNNAADAVSGAVNKGINEGKH
ncbi:MAG TPA: hypothetical protein VMV05_04315 [bacterium]|nr:hypothetical protein [bacterium]